MDYQPDKDRYEKINYRRCGNSGIKLPVLSLGLWHNFGAANDYENCRSILHAAFDNGITHFDLANNYGPPPGAAEIKFGKIFQQDFHYSFLCNAALPTMYLNIQLPGQTPRINS